MLELTPTEDLLDELEKRGKANGAFIGIMISQDEETQRHDSEDSDSFTVATSVRIGYSDGLFRDAGMAVLVQKIDGENNNGSE